MPVKRTTKSKTKFAVNNGGVREAWTVTAVNCDGSKPDYSSMWFSVEEARKHADWLHQSRTVMNVDIQYPQHTCEKVAATAQDVAIGHALAEILDNRTVTPSAKMDINLWLDSKEWP